MNESPQSSELPSSDNEETEAPQQTPRKPSRLVGVLFGVMVLLNLWFSLTLLVKIERWKTVFHGELEVELPGLARGFTSVGSLAFEIFALVMFFWWVIPSRIIPKRGGEQTEALCRKAWFVGFVILAAWGLFAAQVNWTLSQTFASEMGVSLPKESQLLSIAERLADANRNAEERVQAAQELRAYGLLSKANLEPAPPPELLAKLQSLASDEKESPRMRFFAAYALLVLEGQREASQPAIVSAIQAAIDSDDEELREMAERYRTLPYYRQPDAGVETP